MWDFLRARKEGRDSSGNGRRETYHHLPMVRMTNTFVLNGTDDPTRSSARPITASTVVQLGGGQVNPATGDFVFGMTEAYMIENGEITDPLREGNSSGTVPTSCATSTRSATTSRLDRHVRQERPERARRRRPAHGARDRDHRRRHRGVSELLDVARRVAEQARPGEQVEAYVARSRRVAVRAYQGEVESLTSAESSGIGVRVIVDHRVGFAYAGTLDEGAITEALAEARDNAEFGEVDEWNGLAVPDGVEPPELDLYRPELASFPTDRKVELAIELERATLAGDPRITGVRTSSYGDASGEAAIATSTGIAASSRATSCWLTVHALAAQDGEVQWGYGIDVGRTQDELDIAATAADSVERATRMLGARQPKSRRLTVVLDPRVAASFLSIVGGTLTGERSSKDGRRSRTGWAT